MNFQFPFTRPLHSFLIQEGYTHMRLIGVSGNQNFTLIPLQENISDQFEEVDFRIEPINSTEVTDMLYPMLGVSFYVELRDELATKYQQQYG